MSRKYYNQSLRDPLLQFLRDQELMVQSPRKPEDVREGESPWQTLKSSVRCVAPVYGVPLKIAEPPAGLAKRLLDKWTGMNRRTEAAVDSELALLLYPPYDLEGPFPNPLASRFSWEELGGGPAQFFLMVARLDGPDPATARRLVDDALVAERHGVQGRVYVDARGVARGPYYLGDFWLKEAAERLAREGYECVVDGADPLWGEAFPMESAAFYLGWYSEHVAGPFVRPDFTFMKGAVAYHIHSTSAATLRSRGQQWAGPLLACGAAATLGAVYEPFLEFTCRLDTLMQRLCDGYTLAESAYMSMNSVSWQMTVVGDPLYAPFKLSLDEQIRNLEADQAPERDWAHVRKINWLVREGRFNVALQYARDKLAKRDSLVLREKLGDLYARNDLYAEAGAQYERVIRQAESAETALRVGARWMLMLRLIGQKEKAGRMEAELRARWKDSPMLSWLETAVP